MISPCPQNIQNDRHQYNNKIQLSVYILTCARIIICQLFYLNQWIQTSTWWKQDLSHFWGLHSLLGKVLTSYIAQGCGEPSSYCLLGPCHLQQGHPFSKITVSSHWTTLLLGRKHLHLWRGWEPSLKAPVSH